MEELREREREKRGEKYIKKRKRNKEGKEREGGGVRKRKN